MKDRSDCVVHIKASSRGRGEDTFRCKACNNLKSRMNRVSLDDTQSMVDLSSMEKDSMQQLFRDAGDLYGSALKKHMQVCLQRSKVATKQDDLEMDGHYETMDVAEELMAGKPSEWEAIKANSPRMVCPIRRVEMIWLPGKIKRTFK